MGGVLEVRLLGGFEVRAGGAPVAMTSLRAQSLLAYLALRPGVPQRREQVAFLLWPDSAEQQARTNLRHVLHTLRAALPSSGHYLQVSAQTLSLRDVTADVTAFDMAVNQADVEAATDARMVTGTRTDADAVRMLRLAADLYAGDLLDGWYDDWLLADREQYRQRVLAVLARLVPLLERRGELDTATAYAERAR